MVEVGNGAGLGEGLEVEREGLEVDWEDGLHEGYTDIAHGYENPIPHM